MTNERSRTLAGLILLFLLVFLAACASTTGARSEALLHQDYHTLSDEELQTYYLQLNDQIARVERQARDTRVGVGIGSSPLHVGVSTGVTEHTVAEDLRERRNEVRQELSRRGLRD